MTAANKNTVATNYTLSRSLWREFVYALYMKVQLGSSPKPRKLMLQLNCNLENGPKFHYSKGHRPIRRNNRWCITRQTHINDKDKENYDDRGLINPPHRTLHNFIFLFSFQVLVSVCIWFYYTVVYINYLELPNLCLLLKIWDITVQRAVMNIFYIGSVWRVIQWS